MVVIVCNTRTAVVIVDQVLRRCLLVAEKGKSIKLRKAGAAGGAKCART